MSEREILNKLRESRLDEKASNKPKLRGFTDAGWTGFNDRARLHPSGIEPLIAEIDYEDRDYIIVLVANVDNGSGDTYVRAISPTDRSQRVFNNDTLAIKYARSLVKELSNLDSSGEALSYCRGKGFRKVAIGEGTNKRMFKVSATLIYNSGREEKVSKEIIASNSSEATRLFKNELIKKSSKDRSITGMSYYTVSNIHAVELW